MAVAEYGEDKVRWRTSNLWSSKSANCRPTTDFAPYEPSGKMVEIFGTVPSAAPSMVIEPSASEVKTRNASRNFPGIMHARSARNRQLALSATIRNGPENCSDSDTTISTSSADSATTWKRAAPFHRRSFPIPAHRKVEGRIRCYGRDVQIEPYRYDTADHPRSGPDGNACPDASEARVREGVAVSHSVHYALAVPILAASSAARAWRPRDAWEEGAALILSRVDEARDALRSVIEQSRRIVAFTGAGISTECGVPDFRSENSPWVRYKPIEFDLFLSDILMREEAWRRKFALDDIYAGVQPGRGHYALANLASSGKIEAIITQNIDNLHQLSGLSEDRIIELHGNGTYATCLSCGVRYELAAIRREFEATGAAPVCEVCDGPVKAATISFGQAMSAHAMERARLATMQCDLFLAIGSSLVVYPAASFPMLASQNNKRLVIINGEATPLDSEADIVLRGDIGDILEPFAT